MCNGVVDCPLSETGLGGEDEENCQEGEEAYRIDDCLVTSWEGSVLFIGRWKAITVQCTPLLLLLIL